MLPRRIWTRPSVPLDGRCNSSPEATPLLLENPHMILGCMVVSLPRRTKVSGDGVVYLPLLAQRLPQRCYSDTQPRSHHFFIGTSLLITPHLPLRCYPRNYTHSTYSIILFNTKRNQDIAIYRPTMLFSPLPYFLPYFPDMVEF